MKTKYIFLILTFFTIINLFSEELTLRFKVWEGYTPPELLEEFKTLIKSKYNIDLKFKINYANDESEFFDAARVETTSENAYELISPSKSVLKHYKWDMIKNRLVLPLRLKNIPNYKELDKTFRNLEDIKNRRDLFGMPLAWGPYGLVYNTAKFKEAPKSWSIFWDPQYAGRYGVNGTSPGGENVLFTALASGIKGEDIFYIRNVNTPEIKKKLQYLADNSKIQWPGIGTGKYLKEIDFGASWGFGIADMKAMGETWKLIVPEEGASGWVDCWAITQVAKNNPKIRLIAEEYINLFISAKKQAEIVVRQLSCTPVNLNSRQYLTEEERINSNIDNPDYLNKLIFLKALPKRDYNGLRLLWDHANEKNKHKIKE